MNSQGNVARIHFNPYYHMGIDNATGGTMNSADIYGRYVLGLDLGVASIGWSCVKIDGKERPISIGAVGSHVFEEGVVGDIGRGRDESRGAKRREARMPRRMHERRVRRRRKVLQVLQRHGLLPPGDTGKPQAIHEYLLQVDGELRRRHAGDGDRVSAHNLLFRLRDKALDEQLEPDELGRALYHLAQRRGFLSNRKSAPKDEDVGVVKKSIGELQSAMETSGARTLGEYFAGLDPEEERIRRRWTARSMYVHEFDSILNAQAVFHPLIVTDAFRKELRKAIFFQRPLKSQRNLIGRCELVPGARRIAMADRLYQRFRMLQKVNDLKAIFPDGSERHLNPDERQKLLDALGRQGDLSFAAIRGKRVLAFPREVTFNFQQSDDLKKIPGNRTDVRMRKAFGDSWDALEELQRDEIIQEVLSFQDTKALAKRAMKAWGLDAKSADLLADSHFEPGYGSHSRAAIRKLIECMRDGTPYATAKKQMFPDSFQSDRELDELPPVLKWQSSLRNPTVTRTLTELRKLVNEIVRVHGRPEYIRIELARDLKRSRKERERISRDIEVNTKKREKARMRIIDETGIDQPRRSDIEKVLLADECGWRCPYTDRQICMKSLLGEHPQFDVEHILPLSRSLDNSFVNKTLCYHQENRERKGNQTPFEAYSGDGRRFEEILVRVRSFSGRLARVKLGRFEMEEIPDDFVNRQLVDTRYASKLAGDYLALLYGGQIDADGRRRIQVRPGGITAHLRNEWDMHTILGDGGRKSRDDHRHHAVDAIVVALASDSMVQELQQAAERASDQGRRLFAQIAEPWPKFIDEAREKVLAINVSHRLTRRIAGVLHAESLYSKPIAGPDGNKRYHIRKPLGGLSATDMKKGTIIDPVVRKIVTQRWEELGCGDPKKMFAEPESHPVMHTGDGRKVPIHRVRVVTDKKPWTVGEGPRERYVTSKGGSNHHTVIVATTNKQGREIWKDVLVSRYEVHARQAAGHPIVNRATAEGGEFLFSLSRNEHVSMDDDAGNQRLWCVVKLSSGDIVFRLHCDARKSDEAQKVKARIRAGGDKLRKRQARKVRVTILGEIVSAND